MVATTSRVANSYSQCLSHSAERSYTGPIASLNSAIERWCAMSVEGLSKWSPPVRANAWSTPG
ncbi:hypothetical protein D3C85_563930 [compost metagenome]